MKDRLKDWKIGDKLRRLEASDGDKQPLLVSGTNIKTINSQSLLGSGDIAISGGSSSDGYISVTFDNGGIEIEDNSQCDVQVPFNFTISKITLLANTTGSIVIDIWKDSYGNFPPTSADTITSSAKPTISSAEKYQDSTLTGWTKTITSGDTLRFNVNSCTDITRCMILVEGTKS